MNIPTRKLDLLLINPGAEKRAYQNLAGELTAVEPPVWAALLAGFARSRGFGVEILDAGGLALTAEETAERAQEYNPLLTTIVVYGHNPSASTLVMPLARTLCAEIKKRDPQSKVLLIGGHVAALPQRTMEETQADFVAGNEGFYTLECLLKTLQAGTSGNLNSIPSLWYREGTQIRAGSPGPLVKAMDREIPGIPWDLLPMDRYRAHNWHCFGGLARQPYGAFYTALGCPYRCSFCCIHAPFQSPGAEAPSRSYRLWSPDTVIRQIDILVERYGVRNIKICDELFVLNPSHVEGICRLIIERGYDLNIWAYARVDSVNAVPLMLLRQAGIRWLAFGIESASELVRQDVEKDFRIDVLHRTMAQVRAAGIYVAGNFIFGLPEDDEKSMQATLQLALDLKCDYANFYCAMAYPGSQLYHIAQQEGWPLPDSWAGYSQYAYDTLPLPTRHIEGSRVLAFRDNAFHAYFTNPDNLGRMERTFGIEARREVAAMVDKKLERKHTAAPT